MTIKILIFLTAIGLLSLIAWLVQKSNPARTPVSTIEFETEPNPIPTVDFQEESNPPPVAGLSEKNRETLRKGLEYLAKKQFADGHWEGDDGQQPVAMTALVGLALLMETGDRWGLTKVGERKYGPNIRKAVDWLMRQNRRDGLIFSEHPSETDCYMHGHGLATLFLAGVCKIENDRIQQKMLIEFLSRSVKYLVNNASSQGGWYRTAKGEGHDLDEVSATILQIQALQAAENAGIPFPPKILLDGQEYVVRSLEKNERKDRSKPAETAAALVCRCSTMSHRGRYDELCLKWLKDCEDEISVGRDAKRDRDELTHYYYAQAVFNIRYETWSIYRKALFDRLQNSQNQDGSWAASMECPGRISVGPVYATTLWCTILQLDVNRYPSYRVVEIAF